MVINSINKFKKSVRIEWIFLIIDDWGIVGVLYGNKE